MLRFIRQTRSVAVVTSALPLAIKRFSPLGSLLYLNIGQNRRILAPRLILRPMFRRPRFARFIVDVRRRITQDFLALVVGIPSIEVSFVPELIFRSHLGEEGGQVVTIMSDAPKQMTARVKRERVTSRVCPSLSHIHAAGPAAREAC